MSVLVKGMKKPTFCYEIIDGDYKYCPFVDVAGDCVILIKKGIRGGTWTDQYSKCPLVEVPEPHGRLIDEDALKAVAEFYETELELRKAPTVIEAEGE